MDRESEATRFLCAAAHSDRKFRDTVIRKVVYEDHKALAPTYGVDLATVVTHCLAARRREASRSLLLSGLFLLLILLYVPAFAGLQGPILTAIRLGDLRVSVRLVQFLILVSAWALIFHELWSVRYGAIARSLLKGMFEPDKVQTNIDGHIAGRLAAFSESGRANVIAYSGFTPFVGAGFDIGGWSFVVNVTRAKENVTDLLSGVVGFELTDLYEAIQTAITGLHIPGLTTEDLLYVNGKEIRNTPLLPDVTRAPVTRIAPETLRQFMVEPREHARYFKCLRVTSSGGECVLSVFLRFAHIGETLFTETNFFFMPPVHARYRKIDSNRTIPAWEAVPRVALQSLVLLPVLTARGIGATLARPFRPVTRAIGAWWRGRVLRTTPDFDYGAESSVRWDAASPNFYSFFQKLDREMHVKVIERQLLDSIIAFLDARNIDTSDLRDRRTTIQNSGVIMSGGTITAESVAFGERARTAVGRVLGGTEKPASRPAKVAA